MYALYAKIKDAEHFLQKSPDLLFLQKSTRLHHERWMSEMGVAYGSYSDVGLVIYENGVAALRRVRNKSGKLKWETK